LHVTVALYCRVSTEEQAEHGYSIDNQKERLIAYCTSQGWDDYRLYIDDGYTGTNIDRPALQRLIRHAREGKIDTVVVYKLDRLSRRQKDVLHLLEDVFEANDVVFKSATEPFDTSTPLGKAMLGILAVFAQLERDTIVERMTVGIRQRIRAGKWHGGRLPFGYRYNQETGKLEIVPDQAQLIREMYRRFLQGQSLNDLAIWMESRTNERVFDHGIVRDMLRRTIYTGRLRYGDQESTEIADPIIDQETWDMVQAEMRRRSEGRAPHGEYLLSGLLKCGLCGGSVIHIIRNTIRGDKLYSYPLYVCKHQHHRPRKSTIPPCKAGYRRQEELDAWVVEQVKRVAALDPAEVQKELAAARQPQEDHSKVLDELKRKLSSIDAKLDKWYDAFEEGHIDPRMLKDRISRLEEERRVLQERIDDLESTIRRPDMRRFIDVLRLVEEAWDYMTFEEQRNVLRAAIDVIIVPKKGQEPKIVWNV
jgi:site-specific DNA recombinase